MKKIFLFASHRWPYMFLLISLSASLSYTSGNSVEDITQIAPGVYVRPGIDTVVFEGRDIANIGFITGDDCIAVIDSGGSLEEGEHLLKLISKVSNLPVCFVINSHGHPDHILGNLAFKSDKVHFVGHHNLPRVMALSGEIYLKRAAAQEGHEIGAEHIVLPDTLVDDELALDLGNRKLIVRARPSAHSNADLTVLDETTGTLWLSDLLFVRHIPIITGSLNGWIKLIEDLRESPAKRVVPGHGPASLPWPQAAEDQLRYLTTLRRDTRESISEGHDLEYTQQHAGYSESNSWALFDDYHKRNVIAAYTELEWE